MGCRFKEMAAPSHEDSAALEPSPSPESLLFGDFDRSRPTGSDLATGGDVDGEAVSAASEDSKPARALCMC